jgi:hypothetical protein
MKISGTHLLTAFCVAGLCAGIGATYETYRGTALSRVPALNRVSTSREEAPLAPVRPLPSAGGLLALADVLPGASETPSHLRPNNPLTNELLLYPAIEKGMLLPTVA